MSEPPPDDPNFGATSYRRQRRRHLTEVAASLVLAGLCGAAYVYAREASGGRAGALDPRLAIALALFFVVGLIAANWLYLRKADELVWAQNISAAFWGIAVLFIGYPAWLILWMGGVAPEPDALTLYVGTITTTATIYYWKRLRQR